MYSRTILRLARSHGRTVRGFVHSRSVADKRSELSQVSDILTKALARLNATKNDQTKAKAFTEIQAAYGKLETLVIPPGLRLQQIAMSYQLAMVLGTVNDLGIAEVLSESREPDGRMSSGDIEKRSGLPATKVSRLLRFLSSRDVFEEVAPDVWKHTEASKLLDSGLPYDEIVRDPIHRFARGTPFPAWLSHTIEQGGMAAVSMVTAYRDEKFKKSQEVTETPFSKIYHTNVPFWQWLEDEGRVLNMTKGFELNNNRNFDFSFYPWKDLPEDATIVDVGGGVGSAMAALLPLIHKNTKFVVQDLSNAVLEHAKSFWAERDSTVVDSGRVVLQQHNFFTPQPVKGAEVYFMRFILHDWKDAACIDILKHLHAAAAPTSKLLVVEAVVPHACYDLGSLQDNAVEGAYPTPMPRPLPANGGRALDFEACFDMHMLNILNGVERTFEQFREIAMQAGWKPKKVYQTDELSSLKIIEFTKM